MEVWQQITAALLTVFIPGVATFIAWYVKKRTADMDAREQYLLAEIQRRDAKIEQLTADKFALVMGQLGSVEKRVLTDEKLVALMGEHAQLIRLQTNERSDRDKPT